jgi:hypothetical protein
MEMLFDVVLQESCQLNLNCSNALSIAATDDLILNVELLDRQVNCTSI